MIASTVDPDNPSTFATVMTRLLSVLIIPAITLLSGCLSVGPDYTPPEASVDAWSASVAAHVQGSRPQLEKWWKGFNDPVLNKLIDRTLAANRDLKIASQRIYEARAQRGVARSQLFPSANAGAEYARNRASESLFVPPPENPSNLYTAGFDAGWEIDVFGGIRRNIEAADASVGASIETYRDALVTLLAETAVNYVEYRTLQQRIKVANANALAQKNTMDLTNVRFKNDLAPRIDLTQATTSYELTRSVVPLLQSQLAFAKNRLATLTGGSPKSVEKILAGVRSIPSPRPGHAAGLPTDLLRSRPDVRRAERELAAQTELIGVAAADLYPRFSLFGGFNLQSIKSSDFVDAASRTYSFGPAMQWQIFSAGRIRNNINIEESRTEQALLNYENTVLKAVEDVESSMVAVVKERSRKGFLQNAVKSAEETVGMVTDLYKEGLAEFQRVLDANRTKFESEDQLTVSKGEIAKNYIRLYKALGGGTEVDVVPPVEPPKTTATSPFKRKASPKN